MPSLARTLQIRRVMRWCFAVNVTAAKCETERFGILTRNPAARARNSQRRRSCLSPTPLQAAARAFSAAAGTLPAASLHRPVRLPGRRGHFHLRRRRRLFRPHHPQRQDFLPHRHVLHQLRNRKRHWSGGLVPGRLEVCRSAALFQWRRILQHCPHDPHQGEQATEQRVEEELPGRVPPAAADAPPAD